MAINSSGQLGTVFRTLHVLTRSGASVCRRFEVTDAPRLVPSCLGCETRSWIRSRLLLIQPCGRESVCSRVGLSPAIAGPAAH